MPSRYEAECWGERRDTGTEIWLVIDRQEKKPVARIEAPKQWAYRAALAALSIARHAGTHTEEAA